MATRREMERLYMTPENDAESNSASEYKVGPGSPPREHQFQPNVSGNPKGRPSKKAKKKKEEKKGEKTYIDLVTEMFDEPVEVMIGGKRKKVPMFELALRGQLKAAANGKAGPGAQILRMVEAADKRRAKAAEIERNSDEDGRFVREKLNEMARRRSEALGLPPDKSITEAYLELLAEKKARDKH